MKLVDVRKAALITEQPLHRLLYAVGDGIIKSVNVKGYIIVDPEEIMRKVREGVITKTEVMIRRSLRDGGVWEPSWWTNWESPEPQLDEKEYIAWMRDKKALVGVDKTMSFVEKNSWEERGIEL